MYLTWAWVRGGGGTGGLERGCGEGGGNLYFTGTDGVSIVVAPPPSRVQVKFQFKFQNL
jgi:hypothetical protein